MGIRRFAIDAMLLVKDQIAVLYFSASIAHIILLQLQFQLEMPTLKHLVELVLNSLLNLRISEAKTKSETPEIV